MGDFGFVIIVLFQLEHAPGGNDQTEDEEKTRCVSPRHHPAIQNGTYEKLSPTVVFP
jgi:hypothetical protein